MTITVVGIDPSLTGTGVAVIRTTPATDPWPLDAVQLHTVASKGRRGDTWQQRAARLHQLRNDVMDLVPRDTMLAVMEGPAFSKNDSSTHDRAWYWGKLYDAFTHLQIPIAICPPATRAKWATDKGNAGKTDVAIAVAKLWPTTGIRGDDQADALCFASIAAQHLGLPMPYRVLERHKLAIAKIAWPDLISV